MSSFRYKPSRPAAVLGIVVGVGMLAFGITQFGDASGGGLAFLVSWCAVVVGITALNTWAAFSERGSLGTFVSDRDDAPPAGR
ncbi:hypothetical protein SAMN05660657_01186 [Geodermatophilus amargosae]|uniref:Uncharacterized protein n=1 Tax=Geodermatophilus amargosae TaxID=1296565 RepID=A0A1I6YL38_9ACTN|nr:hypothetical protein [Geodermatophilus amargosae]SFT51087.1 hypothetical protein SAMN05660657_01186 [Geodermatophilus amargosae]